MITSILKSKFPQVHNNGKKYFQMKKDTVLVKKNKPFKVFVIIISEINAVPGPKSHEISLMILHQIFKKYSEDPQVRGGGDISKISTRFF